jgi:uncharacterized membrane protein
LWLIIAEWTIIAFAWTFNPTFNLIPFQVIWAIGISMVLLGVLLRLQIKPWVLLLVGLAIILGHNSLDGIESGFKALPPFWWDFLHYGSFTPRPLFSGITVLIAYPFLPWTALMMCGYALGKWYEADVSALIRQKRLIITGSGLILFFIALRSLNSYGDPLPWEIQKSGFYTFLSFINIWKYPPSLLYLSITMGITLIVLSISERWKGSWIKPLIIFGRTAFFYYIIHLYLLHFASAILYFMRGHSFSYLDPSGEPMKFLFVIPGEGFALGGVYLVWILAVIALYFPCKWYDQYKTSHREKWWLSYL